MTPLERKIMKAASSQDDVTLFEIRKKINTSVAHQTVTNTVKKLVRDGLLKLSGVTGDHTRMPERTDAADVYEVVK